MTTTPNYMLETPPAEEQLTDRQRALRDLFVSEFMQDFDLYQATIRTGFAPTFAIAWSKTLWGCPYVQRSIAYLKRLPPAMDEPAAKAAYENNLLRLMYVGSESSQVAASKLYGEFKGYQKPDAGENAADKLVEALKSFATRAPV